MSTDSESEHRGIKRARQDVQGGLEELTRQEGLWFADGNIVIIAESVAFRVHKSILAAKSPVFKDTFTLAQPADIELYDGCEVLHLVDSAEDLRVMLDALYNGLQYHNRQISWPIARSLLTVGHKYDIEAVYQEGLDQLNNHTATTVATLDSSQGHAMGSWSDFAINIANVTRALDLTRIHALALHDCVRFLTTDVLLNGEGEKLHREDLVKCIKGKHIFMHRRHRLLKRIFAKASPDCTTPTNCASCREDGLETLLDFGIDSGDCYRVLSHSSMEDQLGYMAEDGLCDSCVEYLEKIYDEQRQIVLDDLVEIFENESEYV